MILDKKLKYFIIFIAIANVLAFSAILFLFNSIKKDIDLRASQKNDLFQIEEKVKNSEKLEETYQDYNLEFEKIDNLFAKKSTPIEFIEFLEQTADSCFLLIEISNISFQEFQEPKKDDLEKDKPTNLYPWDFFNIKINTKGDFNNSFIFLRKLENSPYLMEFENLSIRKQEQEDKDIDKELFEYISVDLSLKVYAK